MEKTNNRFDQLTNRDISTHYSKHKFWFSLNDFNAALAYWLVIQSPYDVPDIKKPLLAFNDYMKNMLNWKDSATGLIEFSYDQLKNFINEDVFESIPQIEKLNHPKVSAGAGYADRHNNPRPNYDFIDLGALARNVFYMMLREPICEGLLE